MAVASVPETPIEPAVATGAREADCPGDNAPPRHRGRGCSVTAPTTGTVLAIPRQGANTRSPRRTPRKRAARRQETRGGARPLSEPRLGRPAALNESAASRARRPHRDGPDSRGLEPQSSGTSSAADTPATSFAAGVPGAPDLRVNRHWGDRRPHASPWRWAEGVGRCALCLCF